MKRIIFLIFSLIYTAFAFAEGQIYVVMKDGSAESFPIDNVDSLSFTYSGETKVLGFSDLVNEMLMLKSQVNSLNLRIDSLEKLHNTDVLSICVRQGKEYIATNKRLGLSFTFKVLSTTGSINNHENNHDRVIEIEINGNKYSLDDDNSFLCFNGEGFTTIKLDLNDLSSLQMLVQTAVMCLSDDKKDSYTITSPSLNSILSLSDSQSETHFSEK